WPTARGPGWCCWTTPRPSARRCRASCTSTWPSDWPWWRPRCRGWPSWWKNPAGARWGRGPAPPRASCGGGVARTGKCRDGRRVAPRRENARVGRNVVIGRGAYIGPGVPVGDNCKIQNHALVYEPAVLEPGVFIGPAVVLTNDHYPRAVNADGSAKSAHDWEPV